jgi:hypothetical protein
MMETPGNTDGYQMSLIMDPICARIILALATLHVNELASTKQTMTNSLHYYLQYGPISNRLTLDSTLLKSSAFWLFPCDSYWNCYIVLIVNYDL